MTGPGKYDDICSEVRQRTKARGVILIVIEGTYGAGFSAQLPTDQIQEIPSVLIGLAQQIARDAAEKRNAEILAAKESDGLCAVCAQPFSAHVQPGYGCPVDFHRSGRSYFRVS